MLAALPSAAKNIGSDAAGLRLLVAAPICDPKAATPSNHGGHTKSWRSRLPNLAHRNVYLPLSRNLHKREQLSFKWESWSKNTTWKCSSNSIHPAKADSNG